MAALEAGGYEPYPEEGGTIRLRNARSTPWSRRTAR